MKAKTLQKDRVNIITLGCSKNLVDSEVLSGQLKSNNIDVVHESGRLNHNIVVVNTCGFIDKAKEESINTILDQVELKRRGKLDKVYVTGCLSQRYSQDLEKEIPVLENKKKEVENALSSANDNFEKIQNLTAEFEKLTKLLDEKSLRWLEIQEM